MTGREAFISVVRKSLGGGSGRTLAPAAETGLSVGMDDLIKEAEQVRVVMKTKGVALLDQLEVAARRNSWVIERAATLEDAADAVAEICKSAGVRTALRSAEDVFERMPLDRALATAGVSLSVMARKGDRPQERQGLRSAAFSVDAGITGADYAIAETGTVAVHPRKGLSRLISLAPPRHIAIIERGSVLPSLDELFVLERESLLLGTLAGSMNLISGPSRTGDIEATIVQGIHGPVETYMVLVG